MDWDKITIALNKKLDPAAVKPAKSFGPKGDYIEGWHAIAEANRIFGFDGWSYSIKDCKCVSERPRKIGKAPNEKDGWGVTYTVAVYVDVGGGVRREDVGAGHGYDVDCGLAHESAIKEAVTDALKRALRTFGNPFGLALYDKSRENVGVDAPQATPAEIETAVSVLSQAASVTMLEDLWRGYKKDVPHLLSQPAVIDAARKRKMEITQHKEAA